MLIKKQNYKILHEIIKAVTKKVALTRQRAIKSTLECLAKLALSNLKNEFVFFFFIIILKMFLENFCQMTKKYYQEK